MSAPEPTRPPRWHHHPYTGAAIVAMFLVVLGFILHRLGDAERVNEPGDLDLLIHEWVVAKRARLPWLTTLFHTATRLGNPEIAIIATAAVTFGLYALYRLGVGRVHRLEALIWLGAILGGRYLSLALKELYHRDRPPLVHRLVVETSYSFPSGHSVFAAVFCAMLALVLARLIPPARIRLRALAVSLCLVLAVLIGLSRVWLGVHYPTDVLGGLLLGFGWVLAVTMARRSVAHWHSRSRPEDCKVEAPENKVQRAKDKAD